MGRFLSWLRSHAAELFKSPDFILGCAAGVGVAAMAVVSASVRGHLQELMFAYLALGVALIGVTLTALTIFVVFLDETYVAALKQADESVESAIWPFKAVCTIAGSAAGIAAVASTMIEVVTTWVSVLLAGVGTLLAVWSLAAVVQLTFLTAFHGEMRGSLLEGLARARRIKAERLRSVGE